MIEALTGGERRGPVLAELAKDKMRSRIPDLSMAPEGRSGDPDRETRRLIAELEAPGHTVSLQPAAA